MKLLHLLKRQVIKVLLGNAEKAKAMIKNIIENNTKLNNENFCLSFFFKIADRKAITKSSLPVAIISNIQIAW